MKAETGGRIAALDGLKGLMCLLIAFAFHWKWTVDYVPPLYKLICLYTDRCVEIFVALSGYATALGYSGRLADMSLAQFMKRRFFRLMPLYWVTMAASWLVQLYPMIHTGRTEAGIFDMSAWGFLLELSGITYGWFTLRAPINAPAWTVNSLLLCYLLYYLLTKALGKKQRLYVLSFAGAVIPLSLLLVNIDVGLPFLYADTARCVGSFWLGVLIYLLASLSREEIKRLLPVFALCIFITGAVFFFFHNDRSKFMLFVVPAVILAALKIRPIDGLLGLPVFTALGRASYSLYLWHWTVLIFVLGYTGLGGTYIGFAVYVLLTAAVTFISVKYIEPPLGKLFSDIWRKK